MAGPWEAYAAKAPASSVTEGPWASYSGPEQSGGVQTIPGQNGAPTRVIMDMSTKPQDRGAAEAVGRGALNGLTANFYDELKGVAAAGGAGDAQQGGREGIDHLIMGLAKYWFGDKDAEAKYNEAVGKERALTKSAEEQHPVASTIGNLAGAVAFPVGGPAAGAGLAARVGHGMGVGALYGGLSGAGEGIGLEDTLSKATGGALLGGGVGAVAVPAVAALEKTGSAIGKAAAPFVDTFRATRDVDAQAARNIAIARQRDALTGSTSMSASEAAAAKLDGSPIINADVGGETVKALGRSAANTSPEGRNALNSVLDDRYATQSPRVADFVKNLFGYPSSTNAIDTLQAAAKVANRPAYNKAYAEGHAIWDDGLEQFAQAPIMQQAMRMSFVSGRNRAALDGHAPIQNPFVTNAQTGLLELKPGAIPNLQFWDHVQRNLRAMGGEGQGFAKALNAHLDDVVPSFNAARAGAARFFGAEDAVEAGAKFATMTGADALKIGDARKALAQFKPEERKLFEVGFVSNLLAKIENVRDGQDVVKNIFNSEFARKQIELALGAEKASKLEAKLLVERAMNGFRTATQGNSTSARQLFELGLAGAKTPAALAAAAGGVSSYSSGGIGPGDALTAGLVFAARKHQVKIDTNVAKRVAEMLASDNPKLLEAATTIVQKTPVLRQLFLKLDLPTVRGGTSQAPSFPVLQSLGVSRADDQPNIPRPPSQ